MHKIIFICIMSLTSVYAQTIQFREVKFIEGLDLSTYRDGSVSYSENKTIIKYKDGKTITKIDTNLTIHNDDKELLSSIDLNKKPDIALYFKLTKALFSKKFESLKIDFEISKKGKNIYFTPKDNIKKVISNIVVSLQSDEVVDSFTIDFTNKDTIKIEVK